MRDTCFACCYTLNDTLKSNETFQDIASKCEEVMNLQPMSQSEYQWYKTSKSVQALWVKWRELVNTDGWAEEVHKLYIVLRKEFPNLPEWDIKTIGDHFKYHAIPRVVLAIDNPTFIQMKIKELK